MAKKPTPAAGKPAASTVPPAADAAAGATNTQGAGAVAEKSAAVLGGATGDGERAPLAGGGGASGDASSPNDLADAIRAFGDAASALFQAHAVLLIVGEAAGDDGRRLALAAGERINQDLPLNLHRLRDKAVEMPLGLTEIEAKSRDGKPFRRAGHVFGADFATYLVTEDALARILADRGIVLKAFP